MSRTLTLLITLIFIQTSIIAQVTHSVNIGPSVGLPGKNLKAAKTGWGGELDYTAKFALPIGAHIHIGYTHFTNKNFTDEQLSFMPVRAGLTGFIFQDQIFVTADAGISFFHEKDHSDYSKSGFSYGFGAGYRVYFDPEKKPYLNVSVNFNSHNYKKIATSQDYTYRWMNIAIAYGLTWGRKIQAK